MNFKRKLYHFFGQPVYPTVAMAPKDFEHSDEMFERQIIVGALIKKLGGKRILDIGCGFLPIYKYMEEETYEMITSIDPVIEVDDSNAKVKCHRFSIEELEYDNSYDTVILLGLGHTIGKKAFEAVDTILGSSNVKVFILEHFVCRLQSIYVNRITKSLPELGYKRKVLLSIQYPKNLGYNKRQMEVWLR